MKHPLLGPLAAIASGILVYRYVPFTYPELIWTAVAFVLLAILACWRGARVLPLIVVHRALFCIGAMTARWHRQGPPPEIDATGRETVIVGGCVIEPPAISGERERFVLELDRDARAQVTLYTKPGEHCRICGTGRTSSWTTRFACRAISAIRARSITRATWLGRTFIGPSPGRRGRCGCCRGSVEIGSRSR